ncbi:MAG: hypothetical protein RLZZ550_1882 [Verrucomicrobiota bacterium]|jgi:hypothetical protein
MAWAALAAWTLTSGVSADFLQAFAYAKMTVENSRSMSAPAALAKAMQDAPCGLCKVAAAARQASEQSPLAKQEAVKSKVKPDGAVWSVRLPSAAPAASPSFVEIPAASRCPEMIREVPVPPPKANA